MGIDIRFEVPTPDDLLEYILRRIQLSFETADFAASWGVTFSSLERVVCVVKDKYELNDKFKNSETPKQCGRTLKSMNTLLLMYQSEKGK